MSGKAGRGVATRELFRMYELDEDDDGMLSESVNSTGVLAHELVGKVASKV